MSAVLWFVGGLVLVAAISLGAAYLFRARSRSERPLKPEHLPQDWESVMPKEKRSSKKSVSKSTEPSFRRVGVKSSSINRIFMRLK